MAEHFNPAKPLILLPCIIYCASCASTPQTCIQCSLSCDGAPELEQHESVHVLVEHRSDTVLDKIYNVSSLYDQGHCSVPGCFQRDKRYTEKMFAHNDKPVPEILVNKTDLQPDCSPEGMSDRSNGADMNCSNKLQIMLTFCLWIFFHLEGLT